MATVKIKPTIEYAIEEEWDTATEVAAWHINDPSNGVCIAFTVGDRRVLMSLSLKELKRLTRNIKKQSKVG